MYKELKQVQLELITNEEMRSFINNIRKFLRQSKEDYKTNQSSFGIKHLFRGFVIKVQFGANFSQSKYINCNHMIIKHCMLYYRYCQENRNEKLHNREVQRERIISQYHNELDKAKQSNYPQVKKYADQNQVNIETINIEYIRQQIYSLRILKKNAEKYQGKEDIQRFFN